MKEKVAIIGSGNIGTDLLIKIKRISKVLEIAVLVGIDESSDGLARARRLEVQTTHEGIDGLMKMEVYNEINIIFDATSAKAHAYNWARIKEDPGKRVIDLTPAALGPFVVPPVNLDHLKNERNINMVTCGGQATIPIIAAIHSVTPVIYGEIVASIASKSAGPGTRANIDEFTETTSKAIESVGGATKGKAIIVLNPAEPPIIMRDTVFTLTKNVDRKKIIDAVSEMVGKVKAYVPGYSLHQEVQFEEISEEQKIYIEGIGETFGLKTTVFLKVEGAGHYLPSYAGNLDIMTSAALAVGESIVS